MWTLRHNSRLVAQMFVSHPYVPLPHASPGKRNFISKYLCNFIEIVGFHPQGSSWGHCFVKFWKSHFCKQKIEQRVQMLFHCSWSKAFFFFLKHFTPNIIVWKETASIFLLCKPWHSPLRCFGQCDQPHPSQLLHHTQIQSYCGTFTVLHVAFPGLHIIKNLWMSFKPKDGWSWRNSPEFYGIFANIVDIIIFILGVVGLRETWNKNKPNLWHQT